MSSPKLDALSAIRGLEKGIAKLKWQISRLSTTLLTNLILNNDWDEETFNRIHDVFDFHDDNFDRDELSKSLSEFDNPNSIIYAFLEEQLWTDVCNKYLKTGT